MKINQLLSSTNNHQYYDLYQTETEKHQGKEMGEKKAFSRGDAVSISGLGSWPETECWKDSGR